MIANGKSLACKATYQSAAGGIALSCFATLSMTGVTLIWEILC